MDYLDQLVKKIIPDAVIFAEEVEHVKHLREKAKFLIDEYMNKFEPTHTHRNGNDYQVVYKALISTKSPIKDGDMMVVYKNHSGITYVRSEKEFNDGRFKKYQRPTDEDH